MNLFVTGATGFIGSHFVNKAIDASHTVYALRYNNEKPVIKIRDRIHWINGDITKSDHSFPDHIDVIVHIAAYGVSPQIAIWEKCVSVNIIGTLRLLEKAKTHKVEKIILVGTALEYGKVGERFEFIPTGAPLEPVGPYASSKAAASVLSIGFAQEYKMALKILRVFNVYGEGQHSKNLYPSLKNAALKGYNFPMTKGEQLRDFISVNKTASKLIDELDFSYVKKGELIIKHIASGKTQSVRRFAEYWWNEWKAQGKLLFGAIPYCENEVMRYLPQKDRL